MRINNNLIADQMLNNIQSNLKTVSDLQNQLSSGKKFDKPSDSPVDSNRAMRLTDQMDKEKQYASNIDNTLPLLQMSDSALSDVVTNLNSAKVLMSQYMNSASQGTSNALMASNMEQIKSTLLTLANTSYNGRYIFGGYNSTQVTYVQEASGKVRYNGSDDALNVSVSETESMNLSVPGNEIFVTHSVLANSGVGSKSVAIPVPASGNFSITVKGLAPVTVSFADTSNITLQNVVDAINTSGVEAKAYIKSTTEGYRLKIVSNFVGQEGEMTLADGAAGGILNTLGMIDNTNKIVGTQSAVNNGVFDALNRVIDKMNTGDSKIASESTILQDAYSNVLMNQGKIGIMTQSVESRKSLMQDMDIKRQELLSNIQDIDYTEVISKLNKEMTAYQASIQVGAKVMMPSLLDYIK